jgi:regulator of sigma D
MTAANLQDLKQQLVDEYSDGMFDIEDVIEDSGEGSFDIMLGLGEEMLANVKIL